MTQEELQVVRRFLMAIDTMEDIRDRGQDDSGKRDTPSYRQCLAADCEYTEALVELRKLGEL